MHLDDACAEAMTVVLKSGIPALYPFTETKIVKFPLDNGVKELNKTIAHNIFLMPLRLVFGFVDTTAHQGTIITNPFNFKKFDITLFRLRVNSRVIPENGNQAQFW